MTIDSLFPFLILIEWIASIVITLFISPWTWYGTSSAIHPHLYMAFFFGGAITLFPLYLAFYHSGEKFTRHVFAVSQIMLSILIIHLTGSRMESQVLIFGSIALIALYHDWLLLVPATIIIALDQYCYGVLWPGFIWVLLEDVFLILAISKRKKEPFEFPFQ